MLRFVVVIVGGGNGVIGEIIYRHIYQKKREKKTSAIFSHPFS